MNEASRKLCKTGGDEMAKGRKGESPHYLVPGCDVAEREGKTRSQPDAELLLWNVGEVGRGGWIARPGPGASAKMHAHAVT